MSTYSLRREEMYGRRGNVVRTLLTTVGKTRAQSTPVWECHTQWEQVHHHAHHTTDTLVIEKVIRHGQHNNTTPEEE